MPLGDRILCRETGFPFPAWLLMQVGTEGEGQGPPAVSQQLQHHHRLPLLPEHLSPLLQSKGTFINGINAADLLGARLPAEAAQGKKKTSNDKWQSCPGRGGHRAACRQSCSP